MCELKDSFDFVKHTKIMIIFLRDALKLKGDNKQCDNLDA